MELETTVLVLFVFGMALAFCAMIIKEWPRWVMAVGFVIMIIGVVLMLNLGEQRNSPVRGPTQIVSALLM